MQNQKKEEIKYHVITIKTNSLHNKWQYLTCIKVSFLNQNSQNNIVKPKKLYVNKSCIIIKFIWTDFAYIQN